MPAVKELIKTKYASNASSGNANKKSKQLAKCILNVKVGRILSIGFISCICWAEREGGGEEVGKGCGGVNDSVL